MNGRDRANWIVRVESNFLSFCASEQRSAFVRLHNQRKQAGLKLRSSNDLQQAGMKKKGFIIGFDTNGNYTGRK